MWGVSSGYGGASPEAKLDTGGGGVSYRDVQDGGRSEVVVGLGEGGGPVVRPVTRAVVFRGRIRGEEEEGLGDVGSSSNRLKWSTEPNDESQPTWM